MGATRLHHDRTGGNHGCKKPQRARFTIGGSVVNDLAPVHHGIIEAVASNRH
jgi:hypothetical protein